MERRNAWVSRRSRAAALVSCLALLAAPAQADLIDFESIVRGEIVNTQIDGITLVASNPNRSFSFAVGFDSNETATSDPDLQSDGGGVNADPWAGGNLDGVDLGILLILQENNTDCEDGVSLCTDPDDEGERPAGLLRVIFDVPVTEFGFDLVDVENLTAENGSLVFTGLDEDDVLTSVMVPFMDFLTAPGITLGNNTANEIAPFSAESLGLEQINEVDFNLGGSAAIDNLRFEPIPEPATAALLAAGLGLLAYRGRLR